MYPTLASKNINIYYLFLELQHFAFTSKLLTAVFLECG